MSPVAGDRLTAVSGSPLVQVRWTVQTPPQPTRITSRPGLFSASSESRTRDALSIQRRDRASIAHGLFAISDILGARWL